MSSAFLREFRRGDLFESPRLRPTFYFPILTLDRGFPFRFLYTDCSDNSMKSFSFVFLDFFFFSFFERRSKIEDGV